MPHCTLGKKPTSIQFDEAVEEPLFEQFVTTCPRWRVQGAGNLIFSLTLLHQMLNASEIKMFFIVVYTRSPLSERADFALRSSEVQGHQSRVCRMGLLKQSCGPHSQAAPSINIQYIQSVHCKQFCTHTSRQLQIFPQAWAPP